MVCLVEDGGLAYANSPPAGCDRVLMFGAASMVSVCFLLGTCPEVLQDRLADHVVI